jgi:uncharacterized protein YueI
LGDAKKQATTLMKNFKDRQKETLQRHSLPLALVARLTLETLSMYIQKQNNYGVNCCLATGLHAED